jgi:H/ACA ribonucleoprotein complex subunit 3
MVWLLKRCTKCGEYTLKDKCPKCEGKTISPHPAKFSLDDKHLRYKILMKRIAEEESEKE